jgi:membrane-bound lytic murein transglycosylase B
MLSASLAATALATAAGSIPSVVLAGAEARIAPELGPATPASASAPTEPTQDDPVVVTTRRTTQHSPRTGWHAGAGRLDDLPHAALAAYQRSAAVLHEASRQSRLHWTLLAAVGRVLTDHGRRGSHRVDDRGRVRPAIVGKPLRSRAGHRLTDTEAGQLDGDRRFDRPVGPMLLTPADWTVVGVDGDTDGKRNPQDLDDAALAVAVLLCHSGADLRTAKGKRVGLRRIDTTKGFANAVLDVDTAYRRQLRSDADSDLVESVPLTTLPTLPERLTKPLEKPDRTARSRPPAPSGIDARDGDTPSAPEPQLVSTSTDVAATYDADRQQISATAAVSAAGAVPTGGVTFTLTGPGGVEVARVRLSGGSATARFAVTDPGEYTVEASYSGSGNHSGSEDGCVVEVIPQPSIEPSAEPSPEPSPTP